MGHFIWDNIFKKTTSDIDTITRYWKESPLFNNIPERHITLLAQNMHIRNFQQDEVVFQQGDQGAGAILVLEGKVKIMAEETVLAELEQGDFFGEIALAETDKRTADAYCIAPSRLVFFLRQDLEEWIQIEPRLSTIFLMNLASILAQRLQQANQLHAKKN